MITVDYNGPIHRNYQSGRALDTAQSQAWLSAFAEVLPTDRPLSGLDLGSGTGRFSALLADSFGPVTGVEPADAMRAIAAAESAHAQVRYLPGSALKIPADDGVFDYCLMFLVWHHVVDKAAAAREIARVLRPNGVLLLRAQFSDQMPDLWWLRHFPGGPELDASIYRPLAEETDTFGEAGFLPTPGLRIIRDSPSGTKAQQLEKLEQRPYSLFEHMSASQLDAGFSSLRREVEADPDAAVPDTPATLLALTRPPD